MEDIRQEIRWAIEGIQTIVDDLDMIVTDFNDTIGAIDYAEYIALMKTLRKELSDVQIKSWGHRLKLKCDEVASVAVEKSEEKVENTIDQPVETK